tara:strand:- start:2731 stop:3159 length:429 start_codon:yes stop_codon:yes gene_type:complete
MIDTSKYEGCVGWWDIMDGVATPTDPLWIARNTFDSHALTTDCECDAFEELKDTCTMSDDTMCQNLVPFVETCCNDNRTIADMGSMNKATLKEQRATAALIADAPLLLAEVKRLQDYNSALLHWMMNHLDRDENEIKEMIYE